MPNRDKRSFCLGIALRLMQNRLPLAPSQKEPVAFLYNGVRLPKLPDPPDKSPTDDMPYEYAVLYSSISYTGSVIYSVHFCTVKCVVGKDGYDFQDSNYLYTDDSVYDKCSVLGYDLYDNGEWRPNTFIYNGRTVSTGGYFISDISKDHAIWTNHDILYADGTVFMKASDPIPVYE